MGEGLADTYWAIRSKDTDTIVKLCTALEAILLQKLIKIHHKHITMFSALTTYYYYNLKHLKHYE